MAVEVRYSGTPLRVRFLERPNRYVARVRRVGGGPTFLAHVPNPGRMEELLLPGETSGYAIPVDRPERATRFDLVVVRHGRELVSIDSRIGNRMVGAVLKAGGLTELGPGPWRPEVRFGAHRVDFACHGREPGGSPTALIEVKCSNLRVGDTALFPDAPTVRGTAHLRLLAGASRAGIPSSVVFVIQRRGVRRFTPNAALDPGFARALQDAFRAGVRVIAQTLRVCPDRVEWAERVAVDLGTSLVAHPPSSRE